MERTFATVDDLSLLRQYAGGKDPAAFAELVRRHTRLVFSTAIRIAGRSDVAEDVSQDCFLRLAQKAHSIGGSLTSWLHRTAVNRTLELLRSEKSRKRREAGTAAMRISEPANDASELIALVDAALAALPEELRVPLVEHYLCARSQEELAERLKVNQSTISRRIERGLERLRSEIASRGGVGAVLAMMPGLLTDTRGVLPPETLAPSLMKIGLVGIGRNLTRYFTIKTAVIGGASAIAAGAVIVLLVMQFQGNDPTPPTVQNLPSLIAEQWAEATGNEDDDELDGMMAEIPASDIAKSAAFYEQTLGFRRVFKGNDGSIMLKRADAHLLLAPRSPGMTGTSAIGIFVPDVQSLHQQLTRAGANVSAVSDSRYGVPNFTLTDPENNKISIVRETKLK